LSAPAPSTGRRIFDWILGLTLIGMGIVGGFVPVLQGWVLILAGLAVLSSHSRWARAILDRVRGYGRKLRNKVTDRRHRNE
jgi:uncharacterized membrane protein YbaN (DUF454 family)